MAANGNSPSLSSVSIGEQSQKVREAHEAQEAQMLHPAIVHFVRSCAFA